MSGAEGRNLHATHDRSIGPLVACQQVVGGSDGLHDFTIAASAGFDAISVHTSRLGGRPTVWWRDALRQRGLTVVGFMAIRGILAEPVDALEVIGLAADLGARHVIVTTGPADAWDRDAADERCRDWFRRMQPRATEAGLTLALEPLHPLLTHQSYVHSFRHALEIVADAPGAGVALDLAHVWSDPHLISDACLATDAIATVQIADVDRPLLARGTYDRVPLGTGAVPLDKILGALLHHGYTGPLECETLTPGRDRVALTGASRRWIQDAILRVTGADGGSNGGSHPTRSALTTGQTG